MGTNDSAKREPGKTKQDNRVPGTKGKRTRTKAAFSSILAVQGKGAGRGKTITQAAPACVAGVTGRFLAPVTTGCSLKTIQRLLGAMGSAYQEGAKTPSMGWLTAEQA